jgi:hypothetical protein
MESDTALYRVRRDIDRRNKTDMRLYPTMAFAVIVIYTFVAFYRGIFFEDVEEVRSFSIAIVGAGLVLALMYVLATRVNKHNKRDASLMTDVCDFLEGYLPDGADNRDLRIMREAVPETTGQFLLFLLFFATLFPAAFGALFYARGLTDDPDGLALYLVTISFFLGLCIILVNINFPRRHEKRFLRFSDATVRALETIGVSMAEYKQVIGGRNVYFLILLCVITLGFFIVIWLCISMRDFNRHIDEQWYFENNLLAALKMVGLEIAPAGQ